MQTFSSRLLAQRNRFLTECFIFFLEKIHIPEFLQQKMWFFIFFSIDNHGFFWYDTFIAQSCAQVFCFFLQRTSTDKEDGLYDSQTQSDH